MEITPVFKNPISYENLYLQQMQMLFHLASTISNSHNFLIYKYEF